MNKIPVMIVDDHAMVRKGLRMALETQPDIAVVGEAGTLAEAVDMAPRVRPQVITLDLTMPGPSGVSSVEKLRAAIPGVRIIVLTMHDDPAYVRSALALGAMGYVNKAAADTELISAIRAVARGRTFVDVGAAGGTEVLQNSQTASGQTPAESLSAREREVLGQVARGFTNQQIADEMGVSVKTIESYRARLMRKLGLRERAELVRVAIGLGLLRE